MLRYRATFMHLLMWLHFCIVSCQMALWMLFQKNNIATAAFHGENSRQAFKKEQVLETNNIVFF